MGKPSPDMVPIDAAMFSDLEHYCAKLVQIKAKAGTFIPLVWNREQKYLHRRLEEQRQATKRVRALVLKARQRGVSTYVAARLYQRASTRFGQRVFILTHEDAATQNLFDMVTRIHERMDPAYRPKATQDNIHALDFGGIDSGYRVGTAKTKARGRSDTIQLFHGSEVAHWPQAEEHAAGVMQAIGDMEGTEVILESTANGIGGYFYEQWLLAEAGKSDYLAIFIPWFWAEEYRRPVPEGWEISTEEAEYGETYGLEPEQLVWLHFKNIELGGEPGVIGWKFRQEYPANAEEAFQTGGDKSFIPSELVVRARKTTLEESIHAPRVLGVDVARGGKNHTTLIDRKGRRAGYGVKERFDTADLMAIADRVARLLNDEELAIKRAFLDTTGLGAGVYDRLIQLHYDAKVVAVTFGGEPTDKKRFVNKRAEIWQRMLDWLKQAGGVDLIDDDELHRHLCAPVWKHGSGCRFDAADRLLIEKKESIDERLGLSPDDGDALALTFAEEVFEPAPPLGHGQPRWMKNIRTHQSRVGWMGR